MSDTTITPEERARLRSVLSEHGNPQVEDRIILRLLNTVEQAEVNVARLTKERDYLANALAGYGDEDEDMSAADWKEAARRAVADAGSGVKK